MGKFKMHGVGNEGMSLWYSHYFILKSKILATKLLLLDPQKRLNKFSISINI
jgi:hypothetical protein